MVNTIVLLGLYWVCGFVFLFCVDAIETLVCLHRRKKTIRQCAIKMKDGRPTYPKLPSFILWFFAMLSKCSDLFAKNHKLINTKNDKQVSCIIVLVHGTWFKGSWRNWRKLEHACISEMNDCMIVRYSWVASNSEQARRQSAKSLATYLMELGQQYPEVGQLIVGHSHGGSLVERALYLVKDNVHREIITIGTPFISFSRSVGARSSIIRASRIIWPSVGFAIIVVLLNQIHPLIGLVGALIMGWPFLLNAYNLAANFDKPNVAPDTKEELVSKLQCVNVRSRNDEVAGVFQLVREKLLLYRCASAYHYIKEARISARHYWNIWVYFFSVVVLIPYFAWMGASLITHYPDLEQFTRMDFNWPIFGHIPLWFRSIMFCLLFANVLTLIAVYNFVGAPRFFRGMALTFGVMFSTFSLASATVLGWLIGVSWREIGGLAVSVNHMADEKYTVWVETNKECLLDLHHSALLLHEKTIETIIEAMNRLASSDEVKNN